MDVELHSAFLKTKAKEWHSHWEWRALPRLHYCLYSSSGHGPIAGSSSISCFSTHWFGRGATEVPIEVCLPTGLFSLLSIVLSLTVNYLAGETWNSPVLKWLLDILLQAAFVPHSALTALVAWFLFILP